MSAYERFESTLLEILSGPRQRRAEERRRIERQMVELAERERKGRDAAAGLFTYIVQPRLELVAKLLDDGAYQRSDAAAGTVTLNRSRRYDASVTLEMSVSLDREARHVSIFYHLRIVPVLFEYRKEDVCSFPLDAIDEARAAAFVEERLVDCVGTWVEFQEKPAYRKRDSVIDPVCGMEVGPSESAATVVHQGKTYHFCAEICREQFLDDPSRYLARKA